MNAFRLPHGVHADNQDPLVVGRSRMWIVKQFVFPIHRVAADGLGS
jgi:hypothetical protein